MAGPAPGRLDVAHSNVIIMIPLVYGGQPFLNLRSVTLGLGWSAWDVQTASLERTRLRQTYPLTRRERGLGPVAVELSLEEVLQRAIQKEIESQRLYLGLGRMVEDAAAKDAFNKLKEEERQHQDRLEEYLRGDLKEGALSSRQMVDYKIAELLGEPEVDSDMKLKDAFLLAANREKASHDFYLSLAGLHPDGEVKRLLEGLAAQELQHKRRVESLYTEVGFPQTNGG